MKMTIEQMDMVIDLSRCVFLPGSHTKQFVKTMHSRLLQKESLITENQAKYLKELYHKYRKQIGSLNHNLHCQLCREAEEAIKLPLDTDKGTSV